MRKQFIGTCVENPFKNVNQLINMIDNAREITKATFLKHCDVDIDILREMKRFPNDYMFCKNGQVYFFTWSAIEHFYK